MRQISELWIYPVKSMRGTSVQEAALTPRGLEYDREWMVIDTEGYFVTQREEPRLAQITPAITEEGLTLTNAHGESVTVEREHWEGKNRIPAKVWSTQVEGIDQGRLVGSFLSDCFNRRLWLVRMPGDCVRRPRRRTEGSDVRLGFQDGYPILLTSEESLAELDKYAETPVPMGRFRPNIVVRGCDTPYEEDGWSSFTVNDVTFHAVKPCARCVMTTIDQVSGRSTGKEPLRTLSTMRREGKEVLFGMNVNHYGTGMLRVGDEATNIIFGPRPPL